MGRGWRLACVGLMLLPAIGLAQEASPPARGAVAEKKFFPLKEAREGQQGAHGVKIIPVKKYYPLPSDREKLANGNLRMDRSRVTVTERARSPLMVPVETVTPDKKPMPAANKSPEATDNASLSPDQVEPESDAIEGLDEKLDPVLFLFGAEEGESRSFREAMLGHGSAVAGVIRHLHWPIPLSAKHYVSSGFGLRADPFHGRATFHGGIDLAADTGTAVLATADGLVIEVKQDARYGKYIGVQHADGTISRYGHLSKQSVTQGQRVKGGQTIGAVGSTGRSTGAHLDYRVSRNGTRFDPLAVLTVPSSVAWKAKKPLPMSAQSGAATKVVRGARAQEPLGVASRPLPRPPLVIKVQ
jgi:murein DD-endopeptidase MepM/ murein hydrolase activator NlpD